MAPYNPEAPMPIAHSDDVMAQLAALYAEIAMPAASAAQAPGDRGPALAHDVAGGTAAAVHTLGRQATNAEACLETEDAVATHPSVALGPTAGVCRPTGASTRR